MGSKMADENELLAPLTTRLPPARLALAFAPHPDDEVFGCGGTLALLCRQGSNVSVIVATDGAAGGENRTGELVQQREAESRAAATALEIPEPFFWRLPDRGLAYGEPLIERIVTAITGAAADLVLLPSPTELHPDHQALALAGAEAVRRLGGELRALFYEINQPLPNPNLLLDITPVFGLKQAAMACFPSQLAEQPYDRRIEGLNRFRSYFLGAQAEAAEACVLLEAAGLRPGLSLLFDGPLAHRRKLGFAASGDDIPLVSVIVRSIDRSTLERALSSIALQTWKNLEVVVVNAKGGDHTPSGEYCGPFPLRLINQGGEPLRRSAAANRGLAASRGRYLCFLDDDDSMDPGHIAGLVNALCGSPPHEVAYAGIRGQQGTPPHEQLTEFCEAEVDFTRLLLGNVIPIHAVLFSARFVQQGCCFDEQLDNYEDWDFWLQLARQAPFVFVNQISATYYADGESAVGFKATLNEDIKQQAREKLLTGWLPRLTPSEFDAIGSLFHRTKSRLLSEQWQLQQAAAACDAELAARAADLATCNVELAARDAELATRDAELAALYASRSWKATTPLRWFAKQIRRLR